MSSSGEFVLISAADERFFPRIRDLLHSVAEHRPADAAPMDIGVIDLGMTAPQLDQIRPMVKQIVPGRDDFSYPARPAAARWVQALTARPFLRNYFPGYSRYLWMDADIWLQDWRSIELLCSGQGDEVVVTPEIHCAYPYLYGGGMLAEHNRRFCSESFGEEGSNLIAGKAIINAGMFSIGAQSGFWDAYRSLVIQGFNRGPNKWTEQYAMNLALYTGNMRIRPLPAWSNWICTYALPVYDPIEHCLCEPTPPHEKISALHLTGEGGAPLPLWTPDGRKMHVPLEYDAFKRIRVSQDSVMAATG